MTITCWPQAGGTSQREGYRLDISTIKRVLGTHLLDISLLLAPGALSALGLAWLGSGRLPGVDPNAAIEFLLFVPWQSLGLTVAKCGRDSWVLSRATEWQGFNIALLPFVVRRVLPLAALFSSVLLIRFSVFDATVSLLTIVLDSVSVILSNEMFAHGRVRSAASAQMLRYPLFVCSFVIIGFVYGLGTRMLFTLFVVSAITRAAFLLSLRDRGLPTHDPHSNNAYMATQQILNYGLFKNDQLSTALIGSSSLEQRQVFVYLARFPELVAAVAVALSPLFFPKLYAVGTIRRDYQLLGLGMVASLVIAIGILGYRAFAPSSMVIPASLLGAVLVHGLLVGPVNFRTYVLLREKRESNLMSALLKSNFIGLVLIGLITATQQTLPASVLWVIPAQQLAFTLLSRIRSTPVKATSK